MDDIKKITPELAEIIGIHVGDGYLRNDGRRREWDISGSIEEMEYYDEHIIPLFNKTFGLDLKGKHFKSRNTYGFVIRDKKVIEFAHSVLGFPYGNKSRIVQVPKSVFKDISLLKSFLRGYFDTDGHFGCAKKYGKGYTKFKKKFHCYPRVMFSTVSLNLSKNLKEIFNIINLDFCVYKNQPRRITESLKYSYDINGPKRVKKIIEFIESKNKTKTTRYSVWETFGFCPTKISLLQRKEILNGTIDPHKYYPGP